MTQNQISYWKLQEEKRSNVAKETETHRSNRVNEEIANFRNLEEQRHNQASEAIQNLDLEERARHNTVSEGEALRSNLANEYLKGQSNEYNYAVGQGNVAAAIETMRMSVSELARHNAATEAYNYYQTAISTGLRQQELGQERARIINEQTKTSIESSKASETERHNRETEKLNRVKVGNEAKIAERRLLLDGVTLLTRNIPIANLFNSVNFSNPGTVYTYGSE